MFGVNYKFSISTMKSISRLSDSISRSVYRREDKRIKSIFTIHRLDISCSGEKGIGDAFIVLAARF